MPDEAKEHADSIVIGEADSLWEQVLEDFKNGRLKPIYKCDKLHDLKNLPVPRYDLVNRKRYLLPTIPVQTTRGCPHDCEFCSVTTFLEVPTGFGPSMMSLGM